MQSKGIIENIDLYGIMLMDKLELERDEKVRVCYKDIHSFIFWQFSASLYGRPE